MALLNGYQMGFLVFFAAFLALWPSSANADIIDDVRGLRPFELK